MSQQIVIDSLSFAREGKALQGELPVSGLERLHDALAEIAGSVVFRLAGRMSRQDKPQLVLEVTGSSVSAVSAGSITRCRLTACWN